MGKAPRKIWVPQVWCKDLDWMRDPATKEIPYIRADIVDELVTTGQAVVDRWDSPLWKDLPHTADYIHKLRAAIAKAKGESNE